MSSLPSEVLLGMFLGWLTGQALLLRWAVGLSWWRAGAWIVAGFVGLELWQRYALVWALTSGGSSGPWYEPRIALYGGLLFGLPQALVFWGRGLAAVGGWPVLSAVGALLQQRFSRWLLGPVTDVVTDWEPPPLAGAVVQLVVEAGVPSHLLRLSVMAVIISATTGLLVAWMAVRRRGDDRVAAGDRPGHGDRPDRC